MEIRAIHGIFADLIESGRRTIDDVPEQDKEAVQSILDKRSK